MAVIIQLFKHHCKSSVLFSHVCILSFLCHILLLSIRNTHNFLVRIPFHLPLSVFPFPIVQTRERETLAHSRTYQTSHSLPPPVPRTPLVLASSWTFNRLAIRTTKAVAEIQLEDRDGEGKRERERKKRRQNLYVEWVPTRFALSADSLIAFYWGSDSFLWARDSFPSSSFVREKVCRFLFLFFILFLFFSGI